MINIALHPEISEGSCDILTFFMISFRVKTWTYQQFMIISLKKWFLGVSWELSSFVEALCTGTLNVYLMTLTACHTHFLFDFGYC